jgi:type VI secretion system protein ImpJ
LTVRADELSRQRRHRNQTLADFTELDTPSFWLLYTVNSHVASLRELAERRLLHPAEFHRQLLEAASSLTPFSLRYLPAELPAYNHDNPAPGLLRLESMFRELLEIAIPRNYARIPLEATEVPYVYAAPVNDQRYLATGSRAYLAVSSELPVDQLAREAPELIKVASRAQIRELIEYSRPGASITHTSNPSRAIPIQGGFRYFELDTRGEYWSGIQRERNIAVYAPERFRKPLIELIVDLTPSARP